MTNIKDWLGIITSIATIIGLIILFYRTFRDPDIKTGEEIGLIKQGCEFKHNELNKDISAINKSIDFIKENHLKHIEGSLKNHDEKFVKLFTLMDERLPKK